MVRREQLRKNVLKELQSFRARQKQISSIGNEQLRKRQYRELEEILSPFWAWRSLSR